MEKRYNKDMMNSYDFLRIAIPSYDKFQEQISKLIKNNRANSKTIRILDLGCGTGLTSKVILEKNKNIFITALDLEKNMINQAKKRIKSKNVQFVCKNAFNFLPTLKTESFDFVVSALTIHNFTRKNRNKLLKQIFRILKQGGCLINADKYSLDNSKEQDKALNYHFGVFNFFKKHKRPDLKENWIKHYKKDMDKDIIMKEKEAIKDLKEIGFKEIKITYRKHMFAVLIGKK